MDGTIKGIMANGMMLFRILEFRNETRNYDWGGRFIIEREVVYIAELDADVDDVIAVEYLHNKGVLKEVVCDPLPSTWHGKDRKEQLEKLGIKVSNK